MSTTPSFIAKCPDLFCCMWRRIPVFRFPLERRWTLGVTVLALPSLLALIALLGFFALEFVMGFA